MNKEINKKLEQISKQLKLLVQDKPQITNE